MSEMIVNMRQKFRVKIEGVPKIVYYVDANPRTIVKIDGAHIYLWYKDHRIDWSTSIPVFPIEGVLHEIHETECISNRAD